jgi:acylphosphatase
MHMQQLHSTIHVTIQVKGRVQGVFFRASTKHAADHLGIRGQVKNLPDGSVWIAAEGQESVVDAFVAWCHEGPPLAKVTEVIVTAGELANYEGFKVMH